MYIAIATYVIIIMLFIGEPSKSKNDPVNVFYVLYYIPVLSVIEKRKLITTD